jgi:hypothetical protein
VVSSKELFVCRNEDGEVDVWCLVRRCVVSSEGLSGCRGEVDV